MPAYKDMNMLSLRLLEYEGILVHWCPACKSVHQIHVKDRNHSGAVWTWDGQFESPTFSPSIKVTLYSGGICHYYIKQGKIEYSGDCTHSLAGQTVDLPDLPNELFG
jgi:hypothetical protein